jgi:hypothetical protein
MNNTETIEILNDLVQINNDRIAGYEKAIHYRWAAYLFKWHSRCADHS